MQFYLDASAVTCTVWIPPVNIEADIATASSVEKLLLSQTLLQHPLHFTALPSLQLLLQLVGVHASMFIGPLQ